MKEKSLAIVSTSEPLIFSEKPEVIIQPRIFLRTKQGETSVLEKKLDTVTTQGKTGGTVHLT